MRAIKIGHDVDGNKGDIELLDIPSGFPEINAAILGDSSDLVEQVYARGLLVLTEAAKQDIVMLIDEEGLLKGLPMNSAASVLYGTHVHSQPIVGDAYIVGSTTEEWADLPEWITPGIVAVVCNSAYHDTSVFE